ncbi:IS66 family insertion sequence element accessory protein TnpA [Variovorax sp. GT1P44]|uniref:IS66 family insertion sequence element accessory protein TnpA n=1 Tax=Variovorax sp. GT1P44 TaxID=3443742 RepID=UPI003F47883C
MTGQAEAIEAARVRRERVDWRTGQAMVQHDDAFWRDHEQRRLEQGLSVRQYCVANALALSTYRHRVTGKKRSRAKPANSVPQQPGAFVAVSAPRPAVAALVEIALEGMTLRLSGEAAERVLAGVMARLA